MFATKRTGLVTSTFHLSSSLLCSHPHTPLTTGCLPEMLLKISSGDSAPFYCYPHFIPLLDESTFIQTGRRNIFSPAFTAEIFSARTQDSFLVRVLLYSSACSHLCHTSSSDDISALGCQYTQKRSS